MVIKRFQSAVENFGKRKDNSAKPQLPSKPPETEQPSLQDRRALALRGVILFCDHSGEVSEIASDERILGPDVDNRREEILPYIPDDATSSNSTAKDVVSVISYYLSKEISPYPAIQCRAVNLVEIIGCHEKGAYFRELIGQDFLRPMKALLRKGDPSVQQAVQHAVMKLYGHYPLDPNLSQLFALVPAPPPSAPSARTMSAPPFNPQQQNLGYAGGQNANDYGRHRESHRQKLPPPAELAARIEEARNSAVLLQSFVQSTPPAEFLTHDLAKEFGQRISAAQRSIQSYINCEDPPPDEDTLQTLIETSEQLSLVASKHQRAVLQARRLVGPATPAAPLRGDVPILAAPALPLRTNSDGPPVRPVQNQQLPTAPPPVQTTYLPPAGPPPNQSTPDDDEDDEDTLYNPPPAPPASMQANLQRRPVPPTSLSSSVDANTRPYVASASSKGGPVEMPARNSPTQFEEDPFSDEHVSPAQAAVSRAGADELTTEGNPQSYRPGYQSTSTYMQRQKSSGDKLLMRGAR